MTRHGKEVSLRRANRLVVLHAHQAQEDLLRQVWGIRCIAQAPGEKRAQPLAVAAGKRRDKPSCQIIGQVSGLWNATMLKTPRAFAEQKWIRSEALIRRKPPQRLYFLHCFGARGGLYRVGYLSPRPIQPIPRIPQAGHDVAMIREFAVDGRGPHGHFRMMLVKIRDAHRRG